MSNYLEEKSALQSNGGKATLIRRFGARLQLFLALFTLVLCFLSYRGIVSKAFLGDDHVHLVWLRKALVDPALVWHNFYSNWLYAGTTPQCYRPVISVFMYIDYLFWHQNGVGFHLTNLFFHLICCLALWGCVNEVRRWSDPDSKLKLWPVLAAATFALYPSHPEAVSWITGRVDTIVTGFYLCSVYFYMLWRRSGRLFYLPASIIFGLFSLGSKEMAVTIPAVCLFYEFLRPGSGRGTHTTIRKNISLRLISEFQLLVQSFKRCWFMWLLLALYFILRRFALGTFVGGYDDSLSIDLHLLCHQWSRGLERFYVPINEYYANDYRILVWLWVVLTSVVYLASFLRLKRRGHRSQLMFFLLFAIVSLAPVFKLFNGVPDLQGSRFSYLASASVAAIFSFGLAGFSNLIKDFRARMICQLIVVCAYFSCAALMLWVNNLPWVTANHRELSLSKEMNDILNNAKKSEIYAFFNIPNNYRGAYLARNAIGDIGGHPDINWSAVEAGDTHNEVGQLRARLEEGRVRSFFWSDSSSHLESIILPPVNDKKSEEQIDRWNALPFERKCVLIQGAERYRSGDEVGASAPSGTFSVKAGKIPLMVLLRFENLHTWDFEFFCVHQVKAGRTANASSLGSKNDSVSLILSNQYMPTAVIPSSRLISPNNSGPDLMSKDLLFSLRTTPSWFCTDRTAAAVLVFPPACEGDFSFSLLPERGILPYFKRTGTPHDVTKKASQEIQFDVSRIAGAKGALIQISKRNECFTFQNAGDFEDSLTSKCLVFTRTFGTASLQYQDFSGNGQYQVRCWAIDGKSEVFGVSSDYLFVIAQ